MGPFSVFEVKSVRRDTLVISLQPDGADGSYRFQDLHIEMNSIREVIRKRCEISHLVVDLRNLEYTGSELISAFVSILREVQAQGGNGCYCSALPQVRQTLEHMGLTQVWPHYENRREAVEHMCGTST